MALPAASLVRPQATFLYSAATAVVEEFAKFAVSTILKGETVGKGYKSAANKLHITVEAVEDGVLSLCDIFIKAARFNLSVQQMLKFLEDLGFKEVQREALAQYFAQVAVKVREFTAVSSFTLPWYQKLEWRLDVQVASRSSRNWAFPSFLLKLSISPYQKTSVMEAQSNSKAEFCSVFLQIDYITLKAVCLKLEEALAESRSMHSRRIVRQFRI